MNKIYALVTLMFCIMFVGCSDDDKNSETQLLKVVAAEASFDCTGGTGSIRVASPVAVTATSTEDWCEVVVNDNIVNLTVEQNLLVGSRTAMVVIRAGNDETKVPVYQMGDIFDTNLKSKDFTAKGGEITFRMKSNWDVTFEGVDKTWITYQYSAEEEQVTFKIAPLTVGGKYRASTIKVKSGTHELPVTFTQVNMAGKYACYINGGRNAYGTCLIEETETDLLYKITPTGSAFDAPYYAKCRNGQFVIYFGQYLGTTPGNKEYPHVYLCGFDSQGFLIPNPLVEYAAPLDVLYSDGNMFLVFKDNGTWPGQKVDGFYYGLFNNLIENGGDTKGDGIAAIVDLVWLKVADK